MRSGGADENQAHRRCDPYGVRDQEQPLFLVCSSITIFTSVGLGTCTSVMHWPRTWNYETVGLSPASSIRCSNALLMLTSQRLQICNDHCSIVWGVSPQKVGYIADTISSFRFAYSFFRQSTNFYRFSESQQGIIAGQQRCLLHFYAASTGLFLHSFMQINLHKNGVELNCPLKCFTYFTLTVCIYKYQVAIST